MAALINAQEDEIVLGPSTTLNVAVLAQALRPLIRQGDEIIVTNQDHEANSGAWRRLAEFGVVVREWRIDPLSGESVRHFHRQSICGGAISVSPDERYMATTGDDGMVRIWDLASRIE